MANNSRRLTQVALTLSQVSPTFKRYTVKPSYPIEGNYSPCTRQFFLSLHHARIKAVEWGQGYSSAMGVPVTVMHLLVVVSEQTYDKAKDVAVQSGLIPILHTDKLANRLDSLTQWYSIPDHRAEYGDRHIEMGLIHSQYIPFDDERIHFVPVCNIWRPDIIEALRIHLLTIYLYPEEDLCRSSMQLTAWLGEYILYVICGVRYLPKCEVENEVSDEPAWETEGLRRIQQLDWPDDSQFLRPVLQQLVTGELQFDDTTIVPRYCPPLMAVVTTLANTRVSSP